MTAPRKVIELLAATSPKELETNVPYAIDSRCVNASLLIEGRGLMKHSDASDLSLYENTWLAAAISMGSGRRSRSGSAVVQLRTRRSGVASRAIAIVTVVYSSTQVGKFISTV